MLKTVKEGTEPKTMRTTGAGQEFETWIAVMFGSVVVTGCCSFLTEDELADTFEVASTEW